MKKLTYFLIFALTVLVTGITFAQSEKEIKKDIKQKALKEARKEAKKLKKEGFTVAPGQLPMDKQIENTWIKRYEMTDDGNPLYFVADARAVGETHSTAKMQAYEVAKINIAEQIGSKVAGLIKTNLANAQLNSEDAASITKTVASFQSKVKADIGNMLTLFEASKNIDKNTEVYVTLGYSFNAAMKLAKEKLRKELEAEGKVNAKELDNILDF
ncbi:MAG TPA: hypothetical protein ENH02_05645 [Bacteroidetes bacterium]|nr:hypothetical protein [Bacteroidota bacterium]